MKRYRVRRKRGNGGVERQVCRDTLNLRLDRDDLVIVHEPGGNETARFRIRFEVTGDAEPSRGGENAQGFRLGDGQSGCEYFETFLARSLGDGLALLFREALRERRG